MGTLRMTNISANCSFANPELIGQFPLGIESSRVQGANREHVAIGHLGHGVSLSPIPFWVNLAGRSAFCSHISRIICFRSRKEMSIEATGATVACMANEDVLGNGTVTQDVQQAVDLPSPIVVPNPSVAGPLQAARPHQTTVVRDTAREDVFLDVAVRTAMAVQEAGELPLDQTQAGVCPLAITDRQTTAAGTQNSRTARLGEHGFEPPIQVRGCVTPSDGHTSRGLNYANYSRQAASGAVYQ